MRLAVHAGSLREPRGRFALAIAGLAARGHDVAWVGGAAPAAPGVRAVDGERALRALHADLVLGGPRPAACGWLGWRAHAYGMVLDLGVDAVRRWSVLDRLAWDSRPAFGLLAEDETEAARAALGPADLARVVLWHEAAAAPGTAEHPDTELLERACERLLARRGSRIAGAAVFLDRDGTLVEEHGYASDPAQIVLLPGVADALRLLQRAGLRLVVISNQAGIGRGYYTAAAAHATMARLRSLLREAGVELDAIRFCPHAPDAGCACRKPGTALFEAAAEDLGLTLVTSVMIGDKRIDVQAGQATGGMGVLVRTGYGREEEAAWPAGLARPELVADDLAAAARWIVERYESL